jgi:hypothetical protein
LRMDSDLYIDALWDAFCDTLPAGWRDDAHSLALSLGLVPAAGIPWSSVFQHEVTLGAPGLVAAAMPNVPPAAVRSALLAHMLAIIEAFATDRIEDRQVLETAALRRLLGQIRATRDRSIEELSGIGASPYPEAEQRALAAIGAERLLLRDGTALSFRDYTCLSLAKQAAAFPASLALAEAAGWKDRRRQALRRSLEGIVLGLQFHDDVIDWEDDWQQGRAWTVSLSRGLQARASAPDRDSSVHAIRGLVYQAGALARMLDLARRSYRQAARLATVLGAERLGAWAREQECCTGELAKRETESAGYAVRAHQLATWAAEVLA